jgi:hypothetical protein
MSPLSLYCARRRPAPQTQPHQRRTIERRQSPESGAHAPGLHAGTPDTITPPHRHRGPRPRLRQRRLPRPPHPHHGSANSSTPTPRSRPATPPSPPSAPTAKAPSPSPATAPTSGSAPRTSSCGSLNLRPAHRAAAPSVEATARDERSRRQAPAHRSPDDPSETTETGAKRRMGSKTPLPVPDAHRTQLRQARSVEGGRRP